MNRFAFLAGLLLGGWIVLAATPAPAGMLALTVSDLDASIRALPYQQSSDPVDPLRKRLKKLQAQSNPSIESTALNDALSLIRIVRKNQLTATSTVPSRFSHPNSVDLGSPLIATKLSVAVSE